MCIDKVIDLFGWVSFSLRFHSVFNMKFASFELIRYRFKNVKSKAEFMTAHICMYIYNLTNLCVATTILGYKKKSNQPNERNKTKLNRTQLNWTKSACIHCVIAANQVFFGQIDFIFIFQFRKTAASRTTKTVRQNAKSVRPVVATWYKLTVLTLWNEMRPLWNSNSNRSLTAAAQPVGDPMVETETNKQTRMPTLSRGLFDYKIP